MEYTSDPFIRDNFFVIDSAHLKDVSTKLYGFVIQDNCLYAGEACSEWTNLPNDAYGCYVYVHRNDKEVTICQDYFGSYGLYLYKNGKRFCISNSFLLLANYLKDEVTLTFNDDYAKSFISSPQASLVYQETMVREIQLLPRNAIVILNLSGKVLEIKYCTQRESYIDLNSEEAIKILDDWHEKWHTLLKSITECNELDHRFDLSGGKDSRASLACCVCDGEVLPDIKFYTATDDLYTHKEDLEISKAIAKEYGFEIGDELKISRYKIDSCDNLSHSLLVKCGFHKELMPTHFWNNRYFIRITGSGGDLRELWNEPIDKYIDRVCRETVFNTVDARTALKKILAKSVSEIDSNPGLIFSNPDKIATDYFYKQGRQRNHNGKANAELYLSNTIILSPIMDPALYKLNQDIGEDNDHDLLYELIYQRYIPKISKIKFDSSRIVDEKTKLVATKINNKYPFIVKKSALGSTVCFKKDRICPRKSSEKENAIDKLKELFDSEEIQKESYEIFGSEVYSRADRYWRTHSYHPYIAAAGVVETCLIYRLCGISELKKSAFKTVLFDLPSRKCVPRNYYNQGFVQDLLGYLRALRLDIKNQGGTSSGVALLESNDPELYCDSPKWMRDGKGDGIVVQSYKGTIRLIVSCNQSGSIRFRFVGPWMKSSNIDRALPIKVDINKISISDMLTGTILYKLGNIVTVDSNSAHIVELPCTSGEKISIDVDWCMFGYEKEDLFELITELYEKDISDYKFWKPNKK